MVEMSMEHGGLGLCNDLSHLSRPVSLSFHFYDRHIFGRVTLFTFNDRSWKLTGIMKQWKKRRQGPDSV